MKRTSSAAWQWGLLVLILLVAAALRLTGLAWDGYNHYHPDERYITWVATTIEVPDSLATALAPTASSFNPYYWPADAESAGIVVPQDEPRNFAYGHLPLYLGVAATKIVEGMAPVWRDVLPQAWPLTRQIFNGADLIEFRHLTAVARALTGLVDVGTVALVFLLGRRLYGTAAGLLAAAFLAVNVMHIQLAHFFAVDPYLTLFTVATVYALVIAVGRVRAGRGYMPIVLLAAVAIGLAVGSKFSAVMLFLPLALTLWFDRTLGHGRTLARLLLAAAVTFVVFALTNPFAVLDWTCEAITLPAQLGPLRIPALDWRSCYLANIGQQSAMVRGDSAFPFTRQYIGTLPYLYPVLMQLRWGMGPLLGLVAFAGFAWALWRGTSSPRRGAWRPVPGSGAGAAELLVLAWTVPYFVVTGAFFVKFMRYMQPLTPFLMIYGAALLWRGLQGRLRAAGTAIVLVTTGLYALSFVNLYGQAHPWDVASRWIYEYVTPGALILGEKWDDPLPASLVIDGQFQGREQYRSLEQNWLSGIGSGDDVAKLRANLALLAEADYLTLASQRNYGVVGRLPAYYPLSSRYYELLFGGELGYEMVFVTTRSPHLLGVHLWPERFDRLVVEPPAAVRAYLASTPRLSPGYADESFTVYDQPLTIILKNSGRLSLEQMLARFALEEE